MALTKIKTGGIADSAVTTAKINDDAVTDAKVADAITVTGAQTGITSVGTLGSTSISTSSAQTALSVTSSQNASNKRGASFIMGGSNAGMDFGIFVDAGSNVTSGSVIKGISRHASFTGDLLTLDCDTSASGATLINAKDAGTSKFIVKADGNIGISTNAPYSGNGANFSTLNINGTKGGAVAFSRGTNSATTQWQLRTSDDDALRFEYGSSYVSEAMRIASSGDIEIGTSANMTPTGKLAINQAVNTVSIDIMPTTDNTNATSGSIRFWGTVFGTANRHTEIRSVTNGSTANNELAFDTNGSERMRINSSGNVIFQDGCPIQADTGRATGVSVGTSYVNILDFSTLGGVTGARGFYLVTVVRASASVGTSIVLLIGVSSTSNAYIYDTVSATNLTAQMSGANLQIKSTSGTVTCHATAIPIGITGTD